MESTRLRCWAVAAVALLLSVSSVLGFDQFSGVTFENPLTDESLSERCLVLLVTATPSAPHSRESLMFQVLGVALSSETSVHAGLLSCEGLEGAERCMSLLAKAPIATTLLPAVFAFPALTPNLQCLSKPPLPPDRGRQGVRVDIGSTPAALAQVNAVCGTHRQLDGQEDVIGLVARRLVERYHHLNTSEALAAAFDLGPLTGGTSNGSGYTCKHLSAPPTREEFLQRYVAAGVPVVIEGLTAEWAATHRWTDSYLTETYGDKKVHVKAAPNGDFEGCEDISLWSEAEGFDDFIPPEVLSQMPYRDKVVVRPASFNSDLASFLRLLDDPLARSQNVSFYAEYLELTTYLPELLSDISTPSIVRGLLERQSVNLWYSAGNTIGRLHFDPSDNLMCVLAGEKRFTVFHPLENEALAESHIREATLRLNLTSMELSRGAVSSSTSMVMSPVSLDPESGSGTAQGFPRFDQDVRGEAVTCVIPQGSCLFLPAFWWHEVHSKPDPKRQRNVAVNFWYKPFFDRLFPCPSCRPFINERAYGQGDMFLRAWREEEEAEEAQQEQDADS